MTPLMLILIIWISLGVGVLFLLNLTKWAFRTLLSKPSGDELIEHSWRAPDKAKTTP